MTTSGSRTSEAHQKRAAEYAHFADEKLRLKAAQDPAGTAAVLAIYHQLCSITANPDMAEAMRELAFALQRNSSAREEFG